MFRRARFLRCFNDPSQLRPLPRLTFMLEKDNRSLDFVKTHFDETFTPVLTNCLSTSSFSTPPLQTYCQEPNDVEPLTLLLLKILCDTGNLDQMRYIFALSLDEIKRPATELFNVYLVGLCKGDSFTETELENVLLVMKARQIPQDATTYICRIELSLRAGKDALPLWRELKATCAQQLLNEPSSSLQRKLRDLYFIVSRSHYDPTFAFEVFECAARYIPFEPRIIFNFFLTLIHNDAASPQQSCAVLDAFVVALAKENEQGKGGNSQEYALREITVFNILLKCLRWGDTASLQKVREYAKANNLVSSHNKMQESWIAVYTFASAGDILGALDVLEDEPVSANTSVFNSRFGVQLSPTVHLMVSDVHPLRRLILALAKGGAGTVDKAYFHLEQRKKEKLPVTTKSLDLIVASCAELEDEDRAIETLESYREFDLKPTPLSYSHLFRACAKKGANITQKYMTIIAAMERNEVKIDKSIISAMLFNALSQGDLNAAMYAVDLSGSALDGQTEPLESGTLDALLRSLHTLGDEAGIKKVITLIRKTNTNVPALRDDLQHLA